MMRIIHIDDCDEIRCRDVDSSRPGGYPVIEIEGPEIGVPMVWIFPTPGRLRRLRDAISAYLGEHGDRVDDGPTDRVDIMSEPAAEMEPRASRRVPVPVPAEACTGAADDLDELALAAGGVD